MTTWPMIRDGLHERFATLTGLAALLPTEPTAVGDTPLLYTLLLSHEREQAGQISKDTYTALHRVCVAWQDNAGAEQVLETFVDTLPAALQADRRLAGRLTTGYATYTRMDTGWVSIGGILCRAYDFQTVTFEKGPAS